MSSFLIEFSVLVFTFSSVSTLMQMKAAFLICIAIFWVKAANAIIIVIFQNLKIFFY